METVNKAERRKLIEMVFVTFFLCYGLHYFGYFLRQRWYYPAIEPLNDVNVGLHAVFGYLGHSCYWLMFLLYAFVVKKDRKYVLTFLPGRGNNHIKWIFLGACIGFAMNGTCIFFAARHGDISIARTQNINVALFVAAFLAVCVQATQEEVETRGFFFGKMKDYGVSAEVAVIVSSCFFSYLHATNPGFSLVPFLSIFCSGVLYALLYHYSGSLWCSCGIHIMWNFTQDFIFGLPDSGKPSTMSIFNSKINGGSFFYSPDFGVEGSIMSVVMHIVVIAVVVLVGRKAKAKK